MRIAFKSDVMGIAVMCEVSVRGELRVSELMRVVFIAVRYQWF